MHVNVTTTAAFDICRRSGVIERETNDGQNETDGRRSAFGDSVVCRMLYIWNIWNGSHTDGANADPRLLIVEVPLDAKNPGMAGWGADRGVEAIV